MTRTLTDLDPDERARIVDQVHREAELANWGGLSNSRKAALYQAWESQFDLSHATLKDGIMKGFNARQGIPRRAEARIQEEVADIFRLAGVHVTEQAQMWTGKERADLVIGYSAAFPTHVIEIERADSWSEGLRQALWYRAAIFGTRSRHIQPVLLLFGHMTYDRFEQARATCDNNHISLCSHRLFVDGEPEIENSIRVLISGE